MKFDKSRLLRRTFLAGLGTTAAGAILRPMIARAENAPPHRLLIIHRPCGSVPDKWFPSTGGTKDWGVTPILQPFVDASLRSKMVVMKGVDSPRIQTWLGDKHGAGILSMIAPPIPDNGPQSWPIIPGYDPRALSDTNAKFFTAPALSIDQELQQNVSAFQGTPIRSLQLGASLQSMKGTGDPCLRVISYAGFNQPLWPESRPDVAFDNIFGTTMAGLDQAGNDRINAQNKSVLDFVTEDLWTLKSRAPSSQYAKLDSHLTGIRELESRLGATAPKDCGPPLLAALPGASQDDDARYVPALEEQLQIVKTVLECDLTRVVSLTLAYGNSDLHFAKILPGIVTDAEGHHNLSHNGGGPPGVIAQELIEVFYAQKTASLLKAMNGVVESDRSTLLDNTLVVYFNECSTGDHDLKDSPVALFGGKTLGLQGGAYLDFTHSRRTSADVWVEIFQALGYDKQYYGDKMWNLGPCPGLFA